MIHEEVEAGVDSDIAAYCKEKATQERLFIRRQKKLIDYFRILLTIENSELFKKECESIDKWYTKHVNFKNPQGILSKSKYLSTRLLSFSRAS